MGEPVLRIFHHPNPFPQAEARQVGSVQVVPILGRPIRQKRQCPVPERICDRGPVSFIILPPPHVPGAASSSLIVVIVPIIVILHMCGVIVRIIRCVPHRRVGLGWLSFAFAAFTGAAWRTERTKANGVNERADWRCEMGVFGRNVGRDRWLRRNTAGGSIADIAIRSANERAEIGFVSERNC